MIPPETTNDILGDMTHSLGRIADVLEREIDCGEEVLSLLKRIASALEGLERAS